MLQKRPRGDGTVEVTFRMPPLDDVVELSVTREFNNWQVKGVPMSVESDGTWVATLVLEAGRTYRFRSHDNQGRWHNDWEADAYVPNDFGEDDCVLDLTAGSPAARPPAAKGAAKRRAAQPEGGRQDGQRAKGHGPSKRGR